MKCKAVVTPRVDNPEYWSQMQITCATHGVSMRAHSYIQQVAEFQQHKKGH